MAVGPKPALTPEVRTALAPNGLGTALLTIQNVFRRICELGEFYPVSRCCPPGCPREASNTAYPFARHLSRFFVFFLRGPSSKGASAPVELCRVFSARAFRRHAAATKDTSDRRLQSHMSKMSTRTSRGYRLASRSCPRYEPVNAAVHAAPFALASFSIVVPGFLVPDTPHGAPNLWCPRHRPGFTQLNASFTRATETASPPYRVNATANAARDTFLWQGALLRPFTSLIDWSLPSRS